MSILRLLAPLGIMSLVAACTLPNDITTVKSVQSTEASGGTAFTKALLAEYKAYAKYESEQEYEWDHAAVFAQKGLRAAKGDEVAPEELASWAIPAARQGELSKARALLIEDLGNGSKTRVPEKAARAQVKFDCWVEEEAEGDTDSDCRAEFLKVEPELHVAPAPAPAKAAAPAPVAKTKVVKTFIVYFDFNKSDLTPASLKTLNDVVAAQKTILPALVYVRGYTDTVGSSPYNDTLSNKRARIVSDELNKQGVAAKALDITSYGKTHLAVQTPDNTKEAKNRRVEIYFEK